MNKSEMNEWFERLKGSPRLLMEVDLVPAQGDRFQPTGFADLGAALYERPDGTRMLLVETAQSVANRLEHTCLDGDGPRICKELEGLPYVLVKLEGASMSSMTSSLIEAHRLNSPYIISDKELRERLMKEAGYQRGRPLDWKRIAKTVFSYDPNSILHGVFMSNLEDGRVKLPRAITGFIEAEDVREAPSGGVKNNPIDPEGALRPVSEGAVQTEVYGNVPYSRVEYTAKRIRAYFNLDLALLQGYGLEPEAEELLVALGLYKTRSFLESGLRLRTACDLKLSGRIKVQEPSGFEFPDTDSLLAIVKRKIEDCRKKGLFAEPPVTEITCKVKMEKKRKPEEKEDEAGKETEDESES
jgi:CRISPR-associated protein Csb1